jgi:methyl-accepting chemotaxis protein
MRILNNLSIGQRLAMLLGGVCLVLVFVASCGIWGLNSLHAMVGRALKQDEALAHHAAAIETLVLQERRSEKDAFINFSDAAKRDEYAKTWQDKGRTLAARLDDVTKLELSSEDREGVEQVRAQFKAYADGFEATMARIRGGDIKSTQDANAEFGKYKAAVHGMEGAAAALNLRAQERAAGVDAAIAKMRSDVQAVELALAAIGLGLAATAGWLVARSIVAPLRDAVGLAQSVAAGDLTQEPSADGRDELAQLARALGDMVSKLRAVVTQVRGGVESVTTASAQIATGNLDLSQRTEEQASNLQQTAASMEELTATVRQNADNARAASQLASSATQVAARGGQVVGEVVKTMDAITQNSKRMSDIIGVIDGIAFQTNILALNAAVEAARAGEQGRGFAVVASEVRSLAQRSAQAAKEIKTLIVQSVEKVDDGARQVAEAGQTMHDIVNQVKRVNDLVEEISTASVEQSRGIGQVGQAMSQLDQVTQQNAALVEESAAAAESMKHQAIKLTQTVSVFNVGASVAAPART